MDSNDVIEIDDDSDTEMGISTAQPSISERRIENMPIDGEKSSVMKTKNEQEPTTSKHLIRNQTIEEFTMVGN